MTAILSTSLIYPVMLDPALNAPTFKALWSLYFSKVFSKYSKSNSPVSLIGISSIVAPVSLHGNKLELCSNTDKNTTGFSVKTCYFYLYTYKFI